MKYIFVTGGVVSSLGKGLAAAALGTLLESRGLKVNLQKFDPYLNVDPGTMSPFQHGEVYVLADGAETDLDLGHYERFTNCELTRLNNLTSGKVYETVLEKERNGEYLGKTVQVIPHVTDEIKARINFVAQSQPCDVLITEIGGTTGDIEGLPFLEAIRQFRLEVGPRNVLIMHVTLLPFIKVAGELKTKPTQQSIAKLREIGLQPDVVICRSEMEVSAEVRQKVSMFCNVPLNAIIELTDVKNTIYECPLMLQGEGLDQVVGELLGLEAPEADLREWRRFVQRVIYPKQRIKVAVVGKYTALVDAYKSIYESLTHAGAENDCGVETIYINSEDLNDSNVAERLKMADSILVPGGFGDRGVEGKISAVRYARESGKPFLGLCLGMQVATIEMARNLAGLKDANSTEFNPDSPYPVISLLEEQKNVKRKGATMRLGAQPAVLQPGSLAHKIYGAEKIRERHRHRYEFNMTYREQMEKHGYIISGTSPDGTLVEVIEFKDHPFFIACQYHPEFQSKPNKPHPLFREFIAASVKKTASAVI